MLGILTSSCCVAAEWYQTEGVNCSGYQPLGDAVSAITGGGIPVKSAGGPGNYFVSLTAVELNSFAVPTQEKILNVKRLDASSSTTLRNLFLSAADSIKVTSLVNTGTTLSTGLLLPPGVGTAASLVSNYLFSLKDAFASSVRDTGLFIADGGEAYRRLSLLTRKTDNNVFVFSSTEYRVSVGAESRTFVIHACVYPAEISVTEFETTGQYNNKIAKPVGNNQWRTWDIDDQKFEGDPYTYLYQDGGYYYFEQGAMRGGRIVGKNLYRISLFGGPFSFMDYDQRPNGPWKNYYLKVIAR